MTDARQRTVVLVGMMGAGKSSVGAALAALTGWPYRDNDELVEAATGRTAEEIDATDGESALHRAEAAALRFALARPGPQIVAAAAFVASDPTSVELLSGQPVVVYLRARPESLHARIGRGHGRRDDATDLEWLRTRSAERDATYRELAALTIDTDDLSPDEVARRIAAWAGSDAPRGAVAD